MRELSTSALATLLEGAETIEADGFGIKVARLADGTFLKLYRRKRLLSSALWSPPAERFANNARTLTRLGIPAPEILDTVGIPDRQLNGVQYSPLPGDTLRSIWKDLPSPDLAKDVETFGRFLGELHGLGIYFRSLHLGNVLKLPDGRLGLIDLSDMRINALPLNSWKRRRNVRHMLRYPEDANWLAKLHRDDLLRGYAEQAGTSAAHKLRRVIDSHRPAPPTETTSTP